VNLFKDFNADGKPDGPVFKTTQTSGSGFYQFTGLEVALAGDPVNQTKYIVVVDTADPDLGACNVPIPPSSASSARRRNVRASSTACAHAASPTMCWRVPSRPIWSRRSAFRRERCHLTSWIG
jgi:hypothetical protein